MQMNRVVIAAYVTKKPECRYLASGTRVAHVRVGESSRYADGSGETREHTNWHSLSFYGKLADAALALEKGDNVYLDGRIEQHQFAPCDGSKLRTVHEMVVSEPVSRDCTSTKREQGGLGLPKGRPNGSPIGGAEVENDWPVAG